jgi:hypothetical protein
MEDRVILEMSRSEALATWEALTAARAFLGVTADQSVAGGGAAELERLTVVIGRLEAAISDATEGSE